MITMRNGIKYYRENELSKLGYIKKEELKDKIKKKYDSLVRINKTSLKHFEEEILEVIDK
jgi:hypothetical protein